MRFGLVLGADYAIFGLNQRLRLILKTTALNFILKYSNSNKRYWTMKELRLKMQMWTYQNTWICQQVLICFHLRKFLFCFANTSSYPILFHIPQLPTKLVLAYHKTWKQKISLQISDSQLCQLDCGVVNLLEIPTIPIIYLELVCCMKRQKSP